MGRSLAIESETPFPHLPLSSPPEPVEKSSSDSDSPSAAMSPIALFSFQKEAPELQYTKFLGKITKLTDRFLESYLRGIKNENKELDLLAEKQHALAESTWVDSFFNFLGKLGSSSLAVLSLTGGTILVSSGYVRQGGTLISASLLTLYELLLDDPNWAKMANWIAGGSDEPERKERLLLALPILAFLGKCALHVGGIQGLYGVFGNLEGFIGIISGVNNVAQVATLVQGQVTAYQLKGLEQQTIYFEKKNLELSKGFELTAEEVMSLLRAIKENIKKSIKNSPVI